MTYKYQKYSWRSSTGTYKYWQEHYPNQGSAHRISTSPPAYSKTRHSSHYHPAGTHLCPRRNPSCTGRSTYRHLRPPCNYQTICLLSVAVAATGEEGPAHDRDYLSPLYRAGARLGHNTSSLPGQPRVGTPRNDGRRDKA